MGRLLGAAVLLLGLSVALVVGYHIAGVRVDAEGVLHEPFALIPLAWLSGLTGAILIAIAVWRHR